MRFSRAPALFASLLVLVGGGLFAYARMGTADARVLPYTGQLQTGPTTANGDYDFRFGLFVTSGADASCLLTNPSSCTPWGEEQAGVTVSEGRFSVALGSSNTITDADLAFNELFLAIAVKGPSDGAFTLLPEKQEILPTPWAARAAAADDYKVVGTLSVGDGATITGDLDVSGGLWAERAFVGDVGHGGSWAGFSHEDAIGTLTYGLLHRNDGLQTIVNTGAGGTINLRSGNTDRVTMAGNGDLTTTGSVNASGNVAASGTVTGNGIWEKVGDYPRSNALDFTVSGLNGNVDKRYQFVLQGYVASNGQNRAIGVRPNGQTSGYSANAMHWNGHDPGISFQDATSVTGTPLTGKEFLPLATTHHNSDGPVSATGEMNASTGMARMIRSDDVFNRTADTQDIMQTTHVGAWLNTTTNITSLTFTFNGASDFDGLITIYRMR